MLNIKFGTLPNMMADIDGIFRFNMEDEWLEHPLVHKMIRDVDKSEWVTGRVIESPVLGTISPNELSSGTKLLIQALFEPQYNYVGSRCGDNCNKWFLEIAKCLEAEGKPELNLCYYHLPKYSEPFEIRILNTGKVVSTWRELFFLHMELEEEMCNEWDIYGSTKK